MALYFAGVVVASLLVGGFFGFFAFGLGLVVPEPVARPLAFISTALYSALGAAWSANALAPDRTRTRLPTVVGWCLLAGLLLSGLYRLVADASTDVGAASALVFGLWLSLGLIASVASWSLREADRSLTRDALLTLGIAVGGLLFVAGSVAVTCTITPCIA